MAKPNVNNQSEYNNKHDNKIRLILTGVAIVISIPNHKYSNSQGNCHKGAFNQELNIKDLNLIAKAKDFQHVLIKSFKIKAKSNDQHHCYRVNVSIQKLASIFHGFHIP